MKLSVPKGESPVNAGFVPGSKASGKLVWSDSYSEVSQTAGSILTLVSAEVISTITIFTMSSARYKMIS